MEARRNKLTLWEPSTTPASTTCVLVNMEGR